MFISPYDTLACRRHRIKPIELALKQEHIAGSLIKSPIGGSDKILLVTNESRNVPPFAHPMIIKGLDSGLENVYVTALDARGNTRVSRETGNVVPTADFFFAELRAFLMLAVWCEGNSRDLLNIGDLPMRIFSAVLSENVGRRDNLSPEAIEYLRVMSAYYYIGLHHDELPTDEVSMIGYARTISRAVSIPIPVVEKVIDGVPHLKDIERYTVVVSQSDISERLKRHNAALMMNWLGGLWFGPNASEVSAVALEHPPTFVAMLYSAITSLNYRKTLLNQIVDKVDRRGELSSVFVGNIQNIRRMEV